MAPWSDPAQDAGKTARGRVLEEELAAFSSRAGHDLLGPLNQAAALLALFVQRYRKELGPDADALLEHMGSAAERMDSLVAGIGRYLQVASRPPEVRAVNLQAALSAALTVLDPAVKASAATITADALPTIDGDAGQFAAALEILLDNAIKFRRPGEAPRIHVSAVREGDDILIALTDNGIGIDPKHCEEVLLPFRRLHGRAYPGAGLGLATAKLIARLHGGSLRVDPAPVAGTTVTIRLPGR